MDGGFTSNLQAGLACFGRADPVESFTVTGWFVSPLLGRRGADLLAFIDGEPAGPATVLQGEAGPDAPARARRFSYAIPWPYQDGRSHLLSLVLGDGTAIEFPTRSGVTRANLRFRFEERPAPADTTSHIQKEGDSFPTSTEFVGSADPFAGTRITGWAVNRNAPNEPACLRVFVDGHAAGAVRCDCPRDALGEIGLPGNAGGFAFDIPDRYLDGVTHTLAILFDDGTALSFPNSDGEFLSRLEFTAEPVTSIEGVVDGLQGDVIKGWVVRKYRRTGEVEGDIRLQVVCNGITVGEVTADRPRMDVARELRCDPGVGFEFKLPAHCRNGQEFEFVFRALPEGKDLSGCPLPLRHRAPDNVDGLRALADTVGELCAKAFKLQCQIREAMPPAEATVLNYDGWARHYLNRLRGRMKAAEPLPEDAPLISVVMPVYRTNLAHLTAAIESVRAQTYTNWQLIIVDDGSRDRALRACLQNYASTDERITCVFSRHNRGISAATNKALRKAAGAYVVLFDHDDLLVEVALEAMLREALRTGAKVVYSDEDKIDGFGVLSEPNLKPDWNYRLLLSINYICHLVMIERTLLRRVGALRTECDGAQDHDLLLRLSEKCEPGQIIHLPEILYHWRKSAASTADSTEAKPYAIEAGRRAVADHLARRGFADSRVSALGRSTIFRVDWGLAAQPSVTIIIPFKDQIATTRRCLEALLANTEWGDWRVVLVDNGSVTPEAEDFCRAAVRDPHVAVLRVDEPFNYSRLNNIAAREYPADFYVFLNNDVFLGHRNWLRVMMNEALADPKVAIVGAKLLYPDRTVQHAGVVLGVGGIADHAFRGVPADYGGYMDRARCAQQYSAVTAACMLCRADVFMDVGGFDEHDLKVAFNDVDLCLKAGARGLRVVWTPEVVAEHHASMSRGDDVSPGKAERFFYEASLMSERWSRCISADPYYNRNFSKGSGVFTDLH
jgi:O-antigen biosynthesis protein